MKFNTEFKYKYHRNEDWKEYQKGTLIENYNQIKAISFSYQNLTSLPNNLPNSLEYLYCDNNQLTKLPNNLPNSLTRLDCEYNQLTSLPNNLPSSFKELYCINNPLIKKNFHLLKTLKKLLYLNHSTLLKTNELALLSKELVGGCIKCQRSWVSKEKYLIEKNRTWKVESCSTCSNKN